MPRSEHAKLSPTGVSKSAKGQATAAAASSKPKKVKKATKGKGRRY